jgi:hypothetical protein
MGKNSEVKKVSSYPTQHSLTGNTCGDSFESDDLYYEFTYRE